LSALALSALALSGLALSALLALSVAWATLATGSVAVVVGSVVPEVGEGPHDASPDPQARQSPTRCGAMEPLAICGSLVNSASARAATHGHEPQQFVSTWSLGLLACGGY
jgi:hypothetical protein